ncbi:hypothetical protein B5S52_05360 [Pectobacterium brasiliense]|uniref:hypothetical protein n=1 Tax=Pectobacterium brasiliense TaxID=180957 RepID=UPI0009B062C0|nr:hypothetical protein [Pectobacterium brasiliense]ARA75343.1 hypothetical protein B5S52_05360 [Pectobacterium brasiliense]MBN3192170.1 integrase [Pectobacterium brasiliense]
MTEKDKVILTFKPKSEISALENIGSFIKYCKDIYNKSKEGLDFKWDSTIWIKRAVFKKYQKNKEHSLDNDFIDFAKSYVFYQEMIVGRKNVKTLRDIAKLFSIIEHVLLIRKNKAMINEVDYILLDDVLSIVRKNTFRWSSYYLGRELERMVEFLNEKSCLNCGTIKWSSSIKAPESLKCFSKSAEIERLNKLPDERALNAMAEIFSLPDEKLSERDLFISSVYALLMCAPSRVSEILSLPEDCEIIEVDRNNIERYGLRFYSVKGFGADIKWIPTCMVPVAKKAIQRLRYISKNARNFCSWVEGKNNEFFRHPGCPDKDEYEPLNKQEIGCALGYSNVNSIRKIIFSLSRSNSSLKKKKCNLSELWQFIITQLPKDFPWYDKEKKIRYSNALCLVNQYQLSKVDKSVFYKLHKPTSSFFCKILKGNKSTLGILEKHGYVDDKGQSLHIRTHQARHFLNTIAQRGNMSELDIAKWSGRAMVTQNRVYNHVSEDEIFEKTKSLDLNNGDNLTSAFSNSELIPSLPAELSDLDLLDHGAAHVTEFGYCIHDYMMSPCEKFRDCVHCEEHVCIKGGNENLDCFEQRLKEVEKLHSKAQISMKEEDLGADKWFIYQDRTMRRLKEWIAIFKDPDIPDGAKIRFNGSGFTHIQRVLNQKNENLINNIIKNT